MNTALWHALGMGPRWVRRAASAGAGAQAQAPFDVEVEGEGEAEAEVQADRSGSGDAAGRGERWVALRAQVLSCTRCALAQGRTQAVFEAGQRDARWMVVGEAPGAEEDARGEPFVGQAGRLLDNMLGAIGLDRAGAQGEPVYIANVLKCRPPSNRNPAPEEVACCEPFLRRQIALVRPRIILAMGRFAAQSLLRTEAAVGTLRGSVHRLPGAEDGPPVLVTYHPAYLLRTPADKSRAWADLCLARQVFAESCGGDSPPP